jgi:protein involved in polysaccharide export with SLBB domain
MAIEQASIEILISGAVGRAGRTHLDAGATIEMALRAAGGLAWRVGARPEGELVLRRRSPRSRTVSVHRWRIFDEPAESWRSFALEHRDVLVFTWSLQPEPR